MLKHLLMLAAIGLSASSLTSCAGYRLGNSKPLQLSQVNSIAVPLFENKTQEPRLAALITNSMVDAINRDGTYKYASTDKADAQLIGTITSINYSERRASRFDTLKATDLYINIEVSWSLVDSNNQVLDSGTSSGRSQFSIESNQQLARTNAMPDAAKNAVELIMLRIANGF